MEIADIEQLTGTAAPLHNVELAGACTLRDRRSFGCRREGKQAGRFGGLISRI
jgi:hypothetical protein